jgi:hypothetical protein
VIDRLIDQPEAKNEGSERTHAFALLNGVLSREGFEAFYGEDGQCYLRHVGRVAVLTVNPHRPLTPAEMQRRTHLTAYWDRCSEDQFIEGAMFPLFQQVGFDRITAAGHRDTRRWSTARTCVDALHAAHAARHTSFSEATQRRRSDVTYPRSRPDAAVLA